MYNYFAYLHKISSEFELPGFPVVERPNSSLDKYASVEIRKDELQHKLYKNSTNSNNILEGEAPDVLWCKIIGGNTILVEPAPKADPKFVQTVIGGELMAALLRQKGYLVLHGACVRKGKEAIAFIGYSGWGKSTTAAYYIQNGYRLVSEDLLVIEMHESSPVILPGPRSLKLRPDAGEIFFTNFQDFPRIYNATDKRMFIDNNYSIQNLSEPYPLKKIYLLEGTTGEQNAILDLSPREAMIEMVRHTRTTKWLNSETFQKEHFNQCSTLLNFVHVSLLKRKRTLDSLPEIMELISKDVSQQNIESSENNR